MKRSNLALWSAVLAVCASASSRGEAATAEISARAAAPVTCAAPPPASNYNTGSTSANTVPLFQCYKNTSGECLYNFAKPGTAGGWNRGCPPAVAGTNCCRWSAPPPPSVTCAKPPPATNYNVGSTAANNVPLFQCYKNTVGECLYNFKAPGTPGGWNTGCPPAVAGNACCGWKAPPPSPCPAGQALVTQPAAGAVLKLCCSGPGITFFTPQLGAINYQGKFCCDRQAAP